MLPLPVILRAILATVVLTPAMPLAVLDIALVPAAIRPLIHPVTRDGVAHKRAGVLEPTCPYEHPVAVH